MVIGNGLIAKALKEKFERQSNVCVLASGVSNSTSLNEEEYLREINLLSDCLNRFSGSVFVYFSTVSIFDPSLKSAAYIQHKLFVESLLEKSNENCLVLRLPIIVSAFNNEQQLIGFLKSKIESNTTFNVFGKATRYFLDISELPTVVESCMLYFQKNKLQNFLTINICKSTPILVSKLVEILQDVLGKKVLYSVIDKGESYQVNHELFDKIVGIDNQFNSEEELKRMIEKYFN